MKILSPFTLLALLALGQTASAETATCRGTKSGVDSVTAKVTVSEDGKTRSFEFTQTYVNGNPPWTFTANDFDIVELFIGYNRTNLTWGHHNTVVKISADGDFLGYNGARETEDQNTGYRGKLLLQTGPGDRPHIAKYDVVCKP